MQVYLVGGAVRDELLGRAPKERDWVVVGSTPDEMIQKKFKPVGQSFPVFLHPKTKEEYALARTEKKTAPGYQGFSCIADPSVTLEEDLMRRDLTINAIAKDEGGNFIDPYDGIRDLKQKIIRHVSPAFVEDPLRVLRVARFYARYYYLGFTVAEETKQLMMQIAQSKELQALSAERIWIEFEKVLSDNNPEQFLELLHETAALEPLSLTLAEYYRKHRRQVVPLIQKTCAQTANTIFRFMALFVEIHTHEVLKICDDFKIPNKYKKPMISFLKNYPYMINFNSTNTTAILNLLENAAAFKRDQQFEFFLSGCALLFPDENLQALNDKLLQVQKACLSIDATDFVTQGLGGLQIKQALEKERLKIIQNIFNEDKE